MHFSLPKKIISFFSFFLFSAQTFSQVCDTTLWAPNGPVESVYLRDSLLYVGGNFSQVSPVIGHFAAIDSASALVAPPFLMVRGKVNCIAKDSVGRIYVGGRFDKVGNIPISNLFRLDTNGIFDPTFDPEPNSEVYALYVWQNDLYVGGDFTYILGFPRSRGAVIHITDSNGPLFAQGSDTLTDFDAGADGMIYSFCMDSTTGILAGGNFHHIGGVANNYLADLNYTTGICFPSISNPWRTTINGVVKSIAVRKGIAYMAGNFTAFATTLRKGFAAVNISTASVVTGSDAQLNGFADDVKIVGNKIYLGGAFTIAGGQFRNYIACFDSTLNLFPWNPSANGEVLFIQPWKNVICIGGKFNMVGLDTCYHAAMIDSVSGNAHAWNPMFDGNVDAIMPAHGNKLFCGGDFYGAGGVLKNNICAINILTKRPNVWSVKLNGDVSAISANNTSLFIAGNFTNVNSQGRNHIASFDFANHNLNAFNPGVNGTVRTIVAEDSLVFLGGNFSLVNNQQRNNIACVNFNSSMATTWNPNCSGTINKIIADHNEIYAGGFYSQIGGQAHDNLARINKSTGVVDMTWICNTNDGIYDIDLYNGKLFLGGWFLNVQGNARQYFAAVDTADGSVFPENPGFDNYTRCFTRYTTDLFISGPFTFAGANYYPGVCDFDNGNSTFDAWSPNPDAFPQTMAANQNWLFMGGTFSTAGFHYHPNLAMVNINYVTSVNEINTETENLKLYPNPSSGIFYVDAKNISGKISSYEIHDVTGKLISETNFQNQISSFTVDLSQCAAGIYFLEVKTENGKMFCEKISKQ